MTDNRVVLLEVLACKALVAEQPLTLEEQDRMLDLLAGLPLNRLLRFVDKWRLYLTGEDYYDNPQAAQPVLRAIDAAITWRLSQRSQDVDVPGKVRALRRIFDQVMHRESTNRMQAAIIGPRAEAADLYLTSPLKANRIDQQKMQDQLVLAGLSLSDYTLTMLLWSVREAKGQQAKGLDMEYDQTIAYQSYKFAMESLDPEYKSLGIRLPVGGWQELAK